jgi:hypothetical protein
VPIRGDQAPPVLIDESEHSSGDWGRRPNKSKGSRRNIRRRKRGFD